METSSNNQQPFKTSKPFTVFSVKMKEICKKAIDCANKTGDRRFKALFKAIESALSAVEVGVFTFEYDPIKAGTAYFKESPCAERAGIIEEAKVLIANILVDVKQKNNKEEILCLDKVICFLEKFEVKQMYTYQTALNQIVTARKLRTSVPVGAV